MANVSIGAASPVFGELRGSGPLRVLLVGLYSGQYPAVGETHGLSVVAGAIEQLGPELVESVEVCDLVATASERVDQVVSSIRDTQPHVLGLAINYGTFSVFERSVSELRAELGSGSALLLGGALATYLSEDLLQIEPSAMVVRGEGDVAVPRLLEALVGAGNYSMVPNLSFVSADGSVHNGPRELVEPDQIASPSRRHLRPFAQGGYQIFAESSRACSWAVCTFCLRGLTDVDGNSGEYRRRHADSILRDLDSLAELGVDALTFSDEDFLGGGLSSVEDMVGVIGPALRERGIAFDVSATIRSIFDSDDDRNSRDRKSALLSQLAEFGLRKVFLGIESGSRTQLRRYAKGHSATEAAAASHRVIDSGIALELGWIMFDPLCSPDEIVENASFLADNELVPYVSSLTAELRVQRGSSYLRLLENEERRTGARLYERDLNRDTLSYPVVYRDPLVAELVEASQRHQRAAYTIAYPVKNMTRYGRSLLGDGHEGVVEALQQYRRDLLQAILGSLGAGSRVAAEFDRQAELALGDLADSFLAAVASLELDALPPVLRDTVESATSYRRGGP
ncbi:MAG: cobalamin-dependent protein [Actinomycetota bacterium]